VGFIEEVLCAGLFELLTIAGIVVLRKDDDFRRGSMLFHVPQHFDAIAHPQLDIEQDHIGRRAAHGRDGILGRVELADDAEPVDVIQYLAQALSHRERVFHQHDAEHKRS
jgi:hypothetical protein